jgi:hypothetical protein
VTGLLSVRVGELVGEAVARQIHFRLLNNTTQQNGVSHLVHPREALRVPNYIKFFNRIRPPKSLLTLNGRYIPFVNSVKYLGVIFDKKITWRLHIETVATKAYRTFIR